MVLCNQLVQNVKIRPDRLGTYLNREKNSTHHFFCLFRILENLNIKFSLCFYSNSTGAWKEDAFPCLIFFSDISCPRNRCTFGQTPNEAALKITEKLVRIYRIAKEENICHVKQDASFRPRSTSKLKNETKNYILRLKAKL